MFKFDSTKHVAIIQQENDPLRHCLVKSCSECSMTKNKDGKININGLLHKLQYTDKFGMNCRKCPVHLHSRDTGEFAKILEEMDGQD